MSWCRKMRLRFRSRRLLLFVLTVTTISLLLLGLVLRYDLCFPWNEISSVNTVCRLYNDGRIAGNMCHDLCVSKSVILGSCQASHSSKEVVISATWRNRSTVIKSQFSDASLYPSLLPMLTAADPYLSHAEFTGMVSSVVRNNFNISIRQSGDNILSRLWSMSFVRFANNTQNSLAAMTSIWSLVQQYEFLLLKYFEHFNIFPKVMGTCGPLYAVEYLHPLTTKATFGDWKHRLELASKSLDLVEALDKQMHQPLYLCDVKSEHFGLDDNGRLKVLDVDTAFFESVLRKWTLTLKPCTTNSDCGFWECKAKCHPTKRICHTSVLNNNLQILCEKLFLGDDNTVNTFLRPQLGGLLHPAPENAATILDQLLKDCANPNDDQDPDIRHRASDAVKERLRLFLKAESKT